MEIDHIELNATSLLLKKRKITLINQLMIYFSISKVRLAPES